MPEVLEAVRRNYFLCADFSGPRLFLHRERYRDRSDIQSKCALRDVLVQREGLVDPPRDRFAVR